MPTQYVTLEETSRSIMKHCFNDIIKEVVYAMGFPPDTIVVLHNGTEFTKTDNRNNVSIRETPNLPSTVSQRRLLVNITDNYNEDSLSSTTVSQRDAPPIFHDHDIDCMVYPVYVKSDIVINFEYTSPSKTEAMRLRDDIRVKLSDSRNILHHEVEYDIIIPDGVSDFIADIYDLKSRLFPMELLEYFNSRSTERIRLVTDMANASNARLAVHERQVRIIGIMDFSPEPEPIEQDKETNTYKLTIPYKLSMDVPRGMCFTYPPMICNRVMPNHYLQFVEDRKRARKKARANLGYTNSLRALSYFEVQNQVDYCIDTDLPKNVPLFDEFLVRTSHPGYVTLYTFLTEVDETDKKTLLNLRELGDFYLDERLAEFISTVERAYIVNPYMSYFYLSLYQTNKYIDNNILEVDADMTVRSKVELSLVKPVRVALNVCLDTTFLNPTVQERMYDYPEIYLLYLSELVDGMKNFRSEFSRMGVAEATFYRNFILMLHKAVNREDHAFVKTFMSIIVRDMIATQNLVGALRHGYPKLYRKLCTIVDMEKLKYNDVFKRDDMGKEMYAMRTTMIYYKETHRMSELSSGI